MKRVIVLYMEIVTRS